MDKKSPMKNLLTVEQVAEYLQIGRSKAYELVNMKDFPSLRLGKNIRVFENELINWLENQI